MKRIMIIFCSFVLFSFSSCYPLKTPIEKDVIPSQSNQYDKNLYEATDVVKLKNLNGVNQNYSSADFLSVYNNATELINSNDCDLVIEGTVLSSTFVNFNGLNTDPFHLLATTKSIVLVNQVFKGNVIAGETLCLVEIGGLVPSELEYNLIHKGKYPNSPDYTGSTNTFVDYRLEGYKPCEEGENVILILKNMDIDKYPMMCSEYVEYPQSIYLPLNSIQGKYLRQSDGYVDYNGEIINSDDVYIMYLPESFSAFPEKMFKLEDFTIFIQTNLNFSLN